MKSTAASTIAAPASLRIQRPASPLGANSSPNSRTETATRAWHFQIVHRREQTSRNSTRTPGVPKVEAEARRDEAKVGQGCKSVDHPVRDRQSRSSGADQKGRTSRVAVANPAITAPPRNIQTCAARVGPAGVEIAGRDDTPPDQRQSRGLAPCTSRKPRPKSGRSLGSAPHQPGTDHAGCNRQPLAAPDLAASVMRHDCVEQQYPHRREDGEERDLPSCEIGKTL